jgi:endonuclease/exonuclease/phosphatase family metal-dependent hydrolase
MILLIIVLILALLLLCGLLWASGGQTVYASSGSGIIEAIPGALEEEPAPPVGTLAILSYRLAYGLGQQARHNGSTLAAAAMCDYLDQVIEAIVASGADIALLQEVDFASRRTHEIDQLYYIAAALGWGYAARAVTWECRYLPWPPGSPSGRLRAGMGVISRYPLTQNVRQRLPQARPYPLWLTRFAPRPTVQMVDVQCGATTLRLLNVYLEPQGTARQPQARALGAFVREVYTPASVLMGTFSTAAEDSSLDQITSMLIAELGERFRGVTAQGDRPAPAMSHEYRVGAWVGSGLHALEARPAELSEPVTAPLPLTLRLRWALPLVAMNGKGRGQG